MTTVWFTSDHRFHHKNICEYSNRPFLSLEEMHEALIANWNSVVAPGDLVYHLGDFAMTWDKKQAERDKVEKLLKRLHGRKQLIAGNRDRRAVREASGWSWAGDFKVITLAKQRIVLFHRCIRSWDGIGHGWWHLYGHCTETSPTTVGGKCLDVGVDCHNYRPISFEEVAEFMKRRRIVRVDHHTADEHR